MLIMGPLRDLMFKFDWKNEIDSWETKNLEGIFLL